MKVKPFKPTDRLDRNMVRNAREYAFELTPSFMRGLAELATDLLAIARDPERHPDLRVKAANAYRSIASDVLDRTLPKVQMVRAVVDAPAQGDVDWAALRREVLEVARPSQNGDGQNAVDARIH